MENNEEMKKEYKSKSYFKNNDFTHDEILKMPEMNQTLEIDFEIGNIQNNKSNPFQIIFS